MTSYPKSDNLGDAVGPDRESYSLHFHENVGAAVIEGPMHYNNHGNLQEVSEAHRESATDVDDARAKLAAWMQANGWTWKYRQRG